MYMRYGYTEACMAYAEGARARQRKHVVLVIFFFAMNNFSFFDCFCKVVYLISVQVRSRRGIGTVDMGARVCSDVYLQQNVLTSWLIWRSRNI